MRLFSLIKGDLRFVAKYGIAFIYVVFTLIYAAILSMLSGSALEITASILIYTDPTAMGLFFMGAFIMLEKSQRVNCAISVTPVTVNEYIISKAVSLLVPGTVVGGLLCLYAAPENILAALPAIMAASLLFSLCGLICAVKSGSLNGFMIAVIPFEIVICLPALLYIFGVIKSNIWIIHPGVAAIRLISGNTELYCLCVLSMLLWLVPAFYFCRKAVAKYFYELGGGKII